MKRREAIRNVIILGAGASWLASCKNGTPASATAAKIQLTESQGEMLSALTETIIPTTEFSGAKEVGASDFILVMTEDCASPDDQKKFMDGMVGFEELCQAKTSTSFVKCAPGQRLEFLKSIEAKADIPEAVMNFYQWVKQGTIQSFTTSEEYLTKIKNFSLIPPPFKACVPVETV